MLGKHQTLAGVAIAERCEEILLQMVYKPWPPVKQKL